MSNISPTTMRRFKREHPVTLVREFYNAINRSENTNDDIMRASRDESRINQFINRDTAKNLINDTINKLNDIYPEDFLLLVNPGQEEQFISNNELDEIVQAAKNMNAEMNRQQDELRNRIRQTSNPNSQSAGKKRRKRKTKRRKNKKRSTRKASGKFSKPGDKKTGSAFKPSASLKKTAEPKLKLKNTQKTPPTEDELMAAFAKHGLTKSPIHRNLEMRGKLQTARPSGFTPIQAPPTSPASSPTLEDQMEGLDLETMRGGRKRRRKTKRKKRNRRKGGQLLAQTSQSMIEGLTWLHEAYPYAV